MGFVRIQKYMTNVKNRTIFTNDNLHILRGLNTESIDLIYLDPPFNSNRNYSAPIGSEAAGAAFKDTWTLDDIDNAWHGEIADKHSALYHAIHTSELTHGKSMKSYLIMMSIRLLEMHRMLKDTGSIYLHCDPTASHYLKLIMDAVFNKNNFRNEIIWCYTGPSNTKRWFPRKHDILLYYSKSKDSVFNNDAIRIPYKMIGIGKGDTIFKKGDNKKRINELLIKGKIPESWWADNNLTNISAWKKERTGYPTQKPLALLDRIIKASSNEGDIVLDPFCGCATTCVAAERLNRQWIGIDISETAVDLVRMRLEKEMGMFYDVIHRLDTPKRTDSGQLKNYKTYKHRLYGKQEGVCNGCKTHFPFKNLTVDHIVASSKGGTNHAENLQLLCNYCNSLKKDRTQEWLIANLQKQGII